MTFLQQCDTQYQGTVCYSKRLVSLYRVNKDCLTMPRFRKIRFHRPFELLSIDLIELGQNKDEMYA